MEIKIPKREYCKLHICPGLFIEIFDLKDYLISKHFVSVIPLKIKIITILKNNSTFLIIWESFFFKSSWWICRLHIRNVEIYILFKKSKIIRYRSSVLHDPWGWTNKLVQVKLLTKFQLVMIERSRDTWTTLPETKQDFHADHNYMPDRCVWDINTNNGSLTYRNVRRTKIQKVNSSNLAFWKA